jgi:hypothetical protein
MIRSSGSPRPRAPARRPRATAGSPGKGFPACPRPRPTTTSPSIPRNPQRIALGGWTYGLLDQRGRRRRPGPTATPACPAKHRVWRTAIDPDTGRLYAAVERQALYVSDDFGRTWRERRHGRAPASRASPSCPRPEVNPEPFPAMSKFSFALFTLAACSATSVAQPSFTGPVPVPPPTPGRTSCAATISQRVNETLDWYQNAIKPGEAPHPRADPREARAPQGDAQVSQRVLELMAEPQSGDMFWMFPWTAVSFAGRDQLSPRPAPPSATPGARISRCAATRRITGPCITPRSTSCRKCIPTNRATPGSRARAPRRISPRPASTSSTGWISPPPSARANSTRPTTSASTPSPCSTSPPGPRIPPCASAGA